MEITIPTRLIDSNRHPISTNLNLTRLQFEANRQTLQANLKKSFPWDSYDTENNTVLYGVKELDDRGGIKEAVLYAQGFLLANSALEYEFPSSKYQLLVLKK